MAAYLVLLASPREEIVASIEHIVATEVIDVPMEGVASLAGDDVDLRAGRLSKFGTVTIALNLELGDGVNRWINQNRAVRSDVIIRGSIHQPEIVGCAAAAD